MVIEDASKRSNKSENFEKDICDLLNVMKNLKIDLNMVESKKYIEYIR